MDYVHLLTTAVKILTPVGSALGTIALIRTLVQSRPKLVLKQQDQWGKNHLGFLDGNHQVGIALLLSNPRSQPNAVVGWKGEVQDRKGKWQKFKVPSGNLLLGDRPPLPYGVVPLSVPPFAALETHICLWLDADVTLPFTVKISAIDMYGKEHTVECNVKKEYATGPEPAEMFAD